MERRFVLPVASLALLPLALLLAAASAQAQENDPVLNWLETVTLGPEFGGAGKIVSRWVKSPSMSVFGGTKTQTKVVGEVVKHLNETLGKTPLKGIRLLAPNNEKADIRIYFARLKDFPEIGRKHGFRYVEGNWGYFHTFWNDKHEIQRGFVLLESELLQDKSLRHFALEEMTQVLGPMNDSPAYRDSIFFSSGGDGGAAQELSALDKKLLVFLFTHVPPGARQAELRAAYRQHWSKIK